jgi:ubiquinone/menaquinone biosynthesis C-methylase UbiE
MKSSFLPKQSSTKDLVRMNKASRVIQRSRDYFQFARQLQDGTRASHERNLDSIRQADLAPYLDPKQPLRVLDLANGHLRPQYDLLRAAGHHVYGVDIVNRPGVSWANLAYRIARVLYARSLGKSSDEPRLVCGDVAHLPFATNSFDLVTSIAAFEHFLDVPRVVADIQRVTRLGGLIWIWVHPFTSLSGGHNLSLTEVPLRRIPRGINPWDHLRRRHLSFHVPLNEWRINQYIEVFEKYFCVLKQYCALREGEEFLTADIEIELSAYSRDELSCAGYVILARNTG